MARQFQAQRLDVQAFAEDAGALAGESPLADWPRLAQESTSAERRVVRWSARGAMHNRDHLQPQVWLHLQADAALPMVCQRCLEPMEVHLHVQRSFRFVADEAAAAAEDDEAEEDVLALSRAFDLPALVEDELLMELPVVPRHETCPTEVRLSAADDDFEVAPAPNPFAALEALRRKQ